MTASNSNPHHAPSDDLPDRLLDVALSELVGGNVPPDLSSRISAATTFRQPAVVAQVPGTRESRAFWVHLAVAVMLLVSVTIVVLPHVQSAREQSPLAQNFIKSANKNAVSDPRDLGRALSQAPPPTSTPAGEQTKASRGIASNSDFESLTDLVQSTVQSDSFSAGDTAKPTPHNLSLEFSQSQELGSNGPDPAGSPAVPPAERTAHDPHYGVLTDSKPRAPQILRGDLLPTAGPGGPQPAGAGRIKVPATAHGYSESDDLMTETLAYHDRRKEEPDLEQHAANVKAAAKSVQLRGVNNYGGETKNELGVGFIGAGTTLAKESQVGTTFSLGNTTEGTGPGLSGDQYVRIVENPFVKAEGGAAVSTFSIDVDTASYANVRQFLMDTNQLPPPDAVRIEELINYFQYDYKGPETKDEAPFAAHVEVAGCPWAPEHRLARIAVKGRELDRNKRPQSNLVFLVDVSGSMDEPNKLPLVVYGLEQLTRELGENDHIAIVVYASSEGLVLPSTPGTKQETILAALRQLKAGGSTAGGAGIQLAYQLAEDHFIKGGTNRVILCTDGDFNVGVTSTAELERMVEKKAKDTGVFLSVLGFGRGNLNDAMMEAISNHGNGNYHYVDNRSEARRVLVEEMTGTLITIAKDVKIQVEFNPAQVAGYRLIGYEDRMLRTEDFNDDKKDAGEIGAGHTVTALYEIVPAGKKVEVGPVDDLKYQKPAAEPTNDSAKKEAADMAKELLTLKMRYKAPDGDTSKKLEWSITDDGKSFAAGSGDFKFAASVAGFGQLLRNSQYKGNLTYAAVLELAQGGIGEDKHGYRKEFLDMVRKAKELKHE